MIPIFQLLNSDCYDRNRKVLAKIAIILVGIYAGKWGKLDRGVFNSNNYKLYMLPIYEFSSSLRSFKGEIFTDSLAISTFRELSMKFNRH